MLFRLPVARSVVGMKHRAQRGQAAIETIILGPLLALALASGLGLALAAADWVSAAGAARAGARAAEMSLPVAPAVRAALPPALTAGSRVAVRAGVVSVELPGSRPGMLGGVDLPPARSAAAP